MSNTIDRREMYRQRFRAAAAHAILDADLAAWAVAHSSQGLAGNTPTVASQLATAEVCASTVSGPGIGA